ncbi:unnamed protein product [Absidia cylindrospora]
MDLATILNPSTNKQHDHQHGYIDSSFHHPSHPALQSPPLSPKHHELLTSTMINNMKPRSRFSALEDAIICQGVANGLTWGQISGQLPHRKRATCFNRYRTLQGIRKSRPQPAIMSPPSRYASSKYHHHHHLRHHPYPYYRHSFDNHQRHHQHHHDHSQPSTEPWVPSSPPLVAPSLMTDSSRRLSTCSSLSSSSPLPSPSILHHDQWNLYCSSRRASNCSTSSSSSSSTFYRYHRF